MYSGPVARVMIVRAPGLKGRGVRDRDPGTGRPPSGPTGRPAFGVGPISRVSQASHVARATAVPPGTPAATSPASNLPAGFGVPNLRRNVCPHFFMTGARGAIPIQAPHLLKALIRQDNMTSRCQLRGGVHMEHGYVNDVCLTPRFNQCIFYEEELSRE